MITFFKTVTLFMSCFNFLMTVSFPDTKKQQTLDFFFSVATGINTERLAIILYRVMLITMISGYLNLSFKKNGMLFLYISFSYT